MIRDKLFSISASALSYSFFQSSSPKFGEIPLNSAPVQFIVAAYPNILYYQVQEVEMGCQESTNQIEKAELRKLHRNTILKAVTLNYCGVLCSPFEFYSANYRKELQALSKLFQQLRPSYAPNTADKPFSWQISSVDKKLKEKRYCPFYKLTAGIQNNKFISKIRFQQIWEEEFHREAALIQLSVSESEKQETLQFDLLAYHTRLAYIYPIKDIDDATTLNTDKYLTFYEPMFKQVFLNEDRKLEKFLKDLENHSADLVFIQQGNDKLIKAVCAMDNYYTEVSADKDTLILAKSSSFYDLKSKDDFLEKLTASELEMINWNGHSSFMLVDDYILICGHLSSKKNINQRDVIALKSTMKLLREKFPHLDIICGCDANTFLESFDSNIHIFPQDKKTFTTLKKRTSMQTQSAKAEEVVKESKDHLISTLNLIGGQILTINGQVCSEESFLPLEQHPFDHFLVYANFIKK